MHYGKDFSVNTCLPLTEECIIQMTNEAPFKSGAKLANTI